MRYLVLSDLHSNLEALEAVLAVARTPGDHLLLCAVQRPRRSERPGILGRIRVANHHLLASRDSRSIPRERQKRVEHLASALQVRRGSGWGRRAVTDPGNFVQSLIDREILGAKEEGRNDVGPPVTIVRIDESGAHFGKPGACGQSGYD